VAGEDRHLLAAGEKLVGYCCPGVARRTHHDDTSPLLIQDSDQTIGPALSQAGPWLPKAACPLATTIGYSGFRAN
jgi:hypothetical protein